MAFPILPRQQGGLLAGVYAVALAAAPIVAAAQTASQPGVLKAGAVAAKPGPARNFTGTVAVAELVTPIPPGRAVIGLVAFRAGARSNWHTHPAGQTLHVTKKCGWTQREGGAVTRICAGDTANVPAGIRHWHGATDRTAMTHLAITETVEGRAVDWAEPVTDAQFHGPLR